MSVVQALLHFARTRRDEDALIEGDRVITYGEFAGLILRTASHLGSLGLRHGDRVGLCLPDTSDHLAVLLAVAQAGAVAVPLDWRAAPAENGRLVASLGLAFILTASRARGVENCPTIAIDAQWHASVAQALPDPTSAAAWHDPFVIAATSGSTGQPKFTQATHEQYYLNILANWELMELTGRHRCLATLPFYYGAGRTSCMTHLLRGDCLVLYPSLFATAEYVEVLNGQGVTVVGAVPSTVRQLLATGGDGPLLPGVQRFFVTGAPLHPQEKCDAARRLTPHFYEKYGSTETSTMTMLRPEDLAKRADSVGRPHSLAQIEIVDEGYQPLPNGARGMLRFRAPGMGSPLPESAEESRFSDGWFYPGEFGHIDDAGYVFLHGRTSDVIMHGGAKIHPAEVEATLAQHPAVLEVAVLGRRGADNEEAVIAFVVTKTETRAADLLAHCRMRLTAHKVPRQFHLVAELPKNAAGKIDKIALAEQLSRETAS